MKDSVDIILEQIDIISAASSDENHKKELSSVKQTIKAVDAKTLLERAEEICCGIIRPITRNVIDRGIDFLKEQTYQSIDGNTVDSTSRETQKMVVGELLEQVKIGAIDAFRKSGCLVE